MTEKNLEPAEIGRVLKEMRRQKGLTLEEVGRRSGVSKSMLSQIESGKTNPTLALVWKISRGIGRSIQDILSGRVEEEAKTDELQALGAGLHKVSADEYTRLEVDKPGVHFSVLTPPEQAEDLEIYLLQLEAGAVLDSQGHRPGTQEFLTLLEGAVEVSSGDERAILHDKGFFIYPADRQHLIRNLGQGTARIHLTVRFRQGRQYRS